MKKNLIGITMGDPSGTGAEVVLKALSLYEIRNAANYVIIGCEEVINSIAHKLKLNLPINKIRYEGSNLNVVTEIVNGINLLDLDNVSDNNTLAHRPTSECGKASVEYILRGVGMAMEGKIDALVTAPISKEAVKLAGFNFTGHTELLKEMTKSDDVVMLMVGKGLRVSFVTTHLAIKDVPRFIKRENVLSTIKTTSAGLRGYFNIDDPRIAVCGFNPHCGDGNRFGLEESTIIEPAIKQARESGINCIGPISSDVVFNKAIDGEFDAVVVHYHDQGTIPIKMHAFDSGVNITLGIPIIRTSPTHGTAFDIAGKGRANPGSMASAIKTAVMMAAQVRNLKYLN